MRSASDVANEDSAWLFLTQRRVAAVNRFTAPAASGSEAR
jgi:hypothetical protein